MSQRVVVPAVEPAPKSGPTRRGSFNPYTGTLLTPHPELGGWLAALGIGLAFAGIVGWLSMVAPVPLGGDSGTWTALSYPFILYPHPSNIVPFGYPPLMFPVLGFFVLLGGPLLGPRLYLGFVTVLLGLSTYVLGRSLFRFRVTAVLAEALLFVTIPFDRIFFFGGFPTLLALVFSSLALAFGVRYVRGRRPAHLVIFWLATGATLLTHEFVGLALVVTLVIAGFFLLLKRQLPRTIVLSRAGVAGVTVAALGVGAYYLGTRLAHVTQNNYLARNALAHGKFSIAAVLYPLHIQALGGIIGLSLAGGGTPEGSFKIAVGTAAVLFAAMLALAVFKPKYLTPSMVIVGASILAVLAMAIGGWILSIYTDYRRFAYSLYLPFILLGLLAYDTVFHWSMPPERAVHATSGNAASPISRARPQASTAPSDGGRRRGRPVLAPTFAVTAAAVVLVAGGVFGYPSLVGYQHQYTGSLHGWQYVDAMEAIQQSSIPGSILSISGGATQHWTFAMSDRNVYAPTIVGGFIFKKNRVAEDQLAFFPFHFRTTVSNGLEFASVSGNTSAFFDGSPVYGALRFGTPTTILAFPPDSFTVTMANGTVVPAHPPGGPVPLVTVANGPPPQLAIHYFASGYDLTVTTTSVPGGPTYINASAQATGPVGLRDLSFGARAAPGITKPPLVSVFPPAGGHTFVWNVGITAYRPVLTNGLVAPPAVAIPGASSTRSPSTLSVKFLDSSPNPLLGSPSLNVSIQLTTPGANSLGSSIPSVISTPAVLNNWQTRFVLFNNITRPVQKALVFYIEQEYGATVLFLASPWEVLLLPSQLH